MDVISVTATRVTRDLREIPLSVSVIGEAQIAEDPKTDVGDYLRDAPGLQVGQSVYGQRQFSVRGHGSERTMILIDGVRQKFLSALLTEEAGGINLDPADIERIEALKARPRPTPLAGRSTS
ncbi:MAG: Plug domain-containing protein [Deltaproteobacteria bacterium]|jgi:hemoglobin/transferrin/lactoferrin receptor protein|nr:Plug domain-containing protein [Deltaproteobacteria bacterium]